MVGHNEEIDELLEAAMLKELASQAFYIGGQRQTRDAGAVALMKELADEEANHLDWLKRIKEKGIRGDGYYRKKIPDLMIGEYLTGGDSLEGAGLQETLTAAVKREKQAIEFYNDMMSIFRDRSAKALCRRLVRAELGHKYKLESLYDKLFYTEN